MKEADFLALVEEIFEKISLLGKWKEDIGSKSSEVPAKTTQAGGHSGVTAQTTQAGRHSGVAAKTTHAGGHSGMAAQSHILLGHSTQLSAQSGLAVDDQIKPDEKMDFHLGELKTAEWK